MAHLAKSTDYIFHCWNESWALLGRHTWNLAHVCDRVANHLVWVFQEGMKQVGLVCCCLFCPENLSTIHYLQKSTFGFGRTMYSTEAQMWHLWHWALPLRGIVRSKSKTNENIVSGGSLAMIWHWREMTHILGCVVLVDITQFSLVDQWLCDHLVPKAQNHWEMRSPCAITSKTHVSIWMHQQRCRIADGSDLKGDDDSWKIHRKCCHCYSVQLDGRNDRYTFEIRCCLDLSSLEEDREQTAHNYIIFKRHSPHLYNKKCMATLLCRSQRRTMHLTSCWMPVTNRAAA